MESPHYLHLTPGQNPPALDVEGPFKAVVVIETEVTPEWRFGISRWLVASGCLYMMAWGIDCSGWDDSLDEANLEQFGFETIPDDRLVLTTWHENEPLEEVFRYCLQGANHPAVGLGRTCIIHVATEPEEDRLLSAFRSALRS